jgi:hypothetical protein
MKRKKKARQDIRSKDEIERKKKLWRDKELGDMETKRKKRWRISVAMSLWRFVQQR